MLPHMIAVAPAGVNNNSYSLLFTIKRILRVNGNRDVPKTAIASTKGGRKCRYVWKYAKEIKTLKKSDPTLDLRLRDYMCSQFFDIRTFGAVMTTFVKGSLSCGQVRGPVQLGFARSIDPVNVQEISITRIAVTTEADAADKNNTMGNKFIIPYGLYRMNGYISAKLAQNVTGFCNEDLDMLWRAILNMFEFDRSAARGNMAVRKLYVFKHSSALGDAPSWKLFDSIDVHKRDGVDVARSFGDYEVHVNRETIPDSVNVSEMVDHTL